MFLFKKTVSPRGLLLLGLYSTQFLSLSFIFVAIPAILRQTGTDLGQLSWIYAFSLIWILKVFWAPLVDAFGSKRHGHYRIWLLSLQTLLCLLIVAGSAYMIPEKLSGFIWVMGAISITAATLDIAADGLAMRLLAREERGWCNAIQTAGGMVGTFIGGGVLLLLYDDLGWRAAMIIIAGLTALPLFSLLTFEEPQPSDDRGKKDRNFEAGWHAFWSLFRQQGIFLWVLMLATFQAGLSIPYALITPVLVDLGWPLGRIGLAVSLVGSVFGAAGGVGSGFIIRKFGRVIALYAAALCAALSSASLIMLVSIQGYDLLAYSAAGAVMFSYGIGLTALYTIMMDRADPVIGATHFTLQYSFTVLVNFMCMSFSLNLAQSFGYRLALISGVVVSIANFAIVHLYERIEKRV